MTVTTTPNSGATSIVTYHGNTQIRYHINSDGFFTIVPPAAAGHPFGARAEPQRDPNAPAMVLCLAQNGTIGHRPMRRRSDLQFRFAQTMHAPGPLYVISEGGAVGDQRRALGRNPFFPALFGDVYLVGEVDNEAYDEYDGDEETPDRFLCHVRLAEVP